MEVSLWHIKFLTTASLVALANPNVPLTAFPKATSIPSTQVLASTADLAPLYAPPALHNRNKIGIKKDVLRKDVFFSCKNIGSRAGTDVRGKNAATERRRIFDCPIIEKDDMTRLSIEF